MRQAYLAAVLALIFALPGSVLGNREDRAAHPPLLFAFPRIELEGPTESLLDGVDVGFAMPLSRGTSVTANYALDLNGEDRITATYNLDRQIRERIVGRLSAGLMRNQLGIGISGHRQYERYGTGAFAREIGGEFEVGLFLTTPLKWGGRLKEGGSLTTRGIQVDQAGALATLDFAPTRGSKGEIYTSTAWYPRLPEGANPQVRSAQVIAGRPTEFSAPAQVAWTRELRGAVRGGPVVVGDRVYVGGDEGSVYALRLEDGRPLWTVALGSPVTTALTVAEGRVYVGTQVGHLVCVRPPMRAEGLVGSEVWRFAAGAPIVSPPLVTRAGHVIFGTASGLCVALDSNGHEAWSYATGGPVVAGIAASVGPMLVGSDRGGPRRNTVLIYCASMDGVLYALREVDGRPAWTQSTDAPLSGTPLVLGKSVAFANEAGMVYLVDGGSGRTLWKQRVGAPVRTALSAADGRLHVACADGKLLALDQRTGKTVWTSEVVGPLLTPPLATGKRHLFVASQSGVLYALRRQDGRVVWAENTREPISAAPFTGGGFLVLGSEPGRVRAYEPGGTWHIDAPTAVVSAPSEVARPRPGSAVMARPDAAEGRPAVVQATDTGSRIIPAALGQPDGATTRAFPAPGPTSQSVASAPSRMWLLTATNDPTQTPIQVADHSSLVVSGPAPTGTVQVTVNGVPVLLENGQFRTRLDFDGSGAFPVTIEFTDEQGRRSADHRIVIVSPGDNPTSAAPVFVAPGRGGTGNRVTFTASVQPTSESAFVSLLEIREENGKTLRTWADANARLRSVEWDGCDQWGKALPDGQYVAVFTVRDTQGRSRSMFQPVVVDTAGM